MIERDSKEFVRAEALDTGKRLVEAEYDMDDVVACLRYYAGIGGTEAGRVVDTGRADAISRVVYEPIGVCALITPGITRCCRRSGRSHQPCWRATPSCSSRAS